MYSSTADFESILAACRPDVALLIPIPLHASMHTTHKHIMAEVEFSPSIKQGTFDVFLKDISL
jgi:hypothetical protein